jgi:hypothetical protein
MRGYPMCRRQLSKLGLKAESEMKQEHSRFVSLADAIAALEQEAAPMTLTRFSPNPAAHVIIAVNAAVAAVPGMPIPGEHPDQRRDRHITADVELEYLYRLLVERGHARQILSVDDGHLIELTVTRVEIADNVAIYGFVMPKPIAQ